jgi:hypothetical protein
MKLISDINVIGNFSALMRCRGKVVANSRREGHNIFTVTGRNWLTKLVSWRSIAAVDTPYTQRRVRWMGLGKGVQLEAPTVSSLNNAVLATTTQYLAAIQIVEFPTSSSVRFIKEFTLGEITVSSTPVAISEAGLFVDVSPAEPGNLNDGYEDVAYAPGLIETTLNPAIATNSPVAYKTFDAMTKTVDFSLEIRWDLRFI